jgi:hypothetical protein
MWSAQQVKHGDSTLLAEVLGEIDGLPQESVDTILAHIEKWWGPEVKG